MLINNKRFKKVVRNQRDIEIDREIWWIKFIGNTMVVALVGAGVAACAAVIKFL